MIDEQDDILKWAAAVIYAGGADTVRNSVELWLVVIFELPTDRLCYLHVYFGDGSEPCYL